MSVAANRPQDRRRPGTGRAADPDRDAGADLPRTVIERRTGWQAVDLVELWRYRSLLYILAWRDVKVRYKQAVLGIAWAVLQPLATMVVFTLFVGRLAATPTSGVPYPLFVFAGLVPWTFFAAAINSSSQSVVGNQALVTKVYFPRLLIPIGAVGAAGVDFAIAGVLLLPLMLSFGVAPGWGILMVPPILIGLISAAMGAGMLLAALTVVYRDFRHVVPFMVQLWMFATPTIYMQAEAVADHQLMILLPLNPAYGMIRNFRLALLGGEADPYSMAVSMAVSVVLLAAGAAYFRRVERDFADVI